MTSNGCEVEGVDVNLCSTHMYGVMKGGEFAGVQFFIDYARVVAQQMASHPFEAPQVCFSTAQAVILDRAKYC
jgi:hypothetical protein